MRTEALTRQVVIGGVVYDKPWVPSCGACRSPWLASIDSALAEGYSFAMVHKLLAGRRPAAPSVQILRGHVGHLAEPHAKSRLAFEEAAAARGDDTSSSSAQLPDTLAALIRAGSERLAHGELEVGARDMVAAMRLQVQLDARATEGVEAAAWQAAFAAFFEIVRRHLSPAQWRAFTADVYASPEIAGILAGPSQVTGGAA